jgi:hypothetical protein
VTVQSAVGDGSPRVGPLVFKHLPSFRIFPENIHLSIGFPVRIHIGILVPVPPAQIPIFHGGNHGLVTCDSTHPDLQQPFGGGIQRIGYDPAFFLMAMEQIQDFLDGRSSWIERYMATPILNSNWNITD